MKLWLQALLASLALLASPIGFATANATSTDTVMLVLDASGSMKGAKIASAIEVGKTFLTTVPTGIKVGLVTFNSKEVAVIPPTLDFTALSVALSAVKTEGDTALYDGILSAINAIESQASARIVVLTDGDDTASKAIPAEVVSAISKSQVSLDVVTVGDATNEIGILREFTQAGNGRLLQTADAIQLADGFTKVLASAPAITPHTAAVAIPEMAAPLIVESTNSVVIKLLKVVATILISGMLLFGIRVLSRRRRVRNFAEMLDTYSVTLIQSEEAVKTKTRTEFEPSDPIIRRARNLTLAPTKSTLFPGIADKLDRAGITVSAERWITYWAIFCLLMILGLTLISNSLVIGAIFALIAAFSIQNSFLKSREGALNREFEERLADFLTIIASGLRAGLSFAQAVESAVGEGSGEVERQIRRALAEVQVGLTLDAALMRVAKKMESDDLKWTIAALRIQREVGGNLSKILDTASVTIRNRAELKREIRTLSAEGRLSAYVLVALPLGIFGFLLLSRRDYVKIFWTETIGMIMLAIFAMLVTAGWFWIRSVVTVRV
jgi:Flp pilus assembly protein TadB